MVSPVLMTRVVLSTAVAAALLLPASGAAAPATVPLPAQRNALEVCIALTEPDNPGVDRSDTDARLRQPDNRVEGRDWSGQNLAGRSFSGKVLLDVKLKGASLRGADLTDAIICRSDLTNADLAGARLDRVLIGGWTELNGADLTNASARGLTIADASGAIRIDGADLRDASIMCDPEETTRCIGTGVTFVSMKGADLRGGVVDHLCCAAPGLGSARLAGVTTQLNGYGDIDFIQLAAGTGQSGRITFIPDYGFSGRRTEFTGEELRRLAGVVGRMRSASAHPSFDCSRAATKVERPFAPIPSWRRSTAR